MSVTAADSLLEPLRQLHDTIRDVVIAATERQSLSDLSAVSREESSDTIYAIDVVSEDLLLGFFEKLSAQHSFILIAEGLPKGQITLPRGTNDKDATFRIIVDPIDGTRGLMYQKRSAWVLSGVAFNRGLETSLSDIVLAVQTEIPLVKQHLSDQLWAIRGQGAQAERFNRLTGERVPIRLGPSTAGTIEHGFAMISRFFPGVRDELGAIDDEIVAGALGPTRPGKALCFEDQYISSGGQLYELIAGHDRFVADLRPLMEQVVAARGQRLGICCHPYDLCTALIAEEMGVVVTGLAGSPLTAPLDVTTEVGWAGYANARIRQQIEPLLQEALRRRGLLVI
jgi:fructose-1,6-bisphosphatase/inositol monophosphatase family enzyme